MKIVIAHLARASMIHIYVYEGVPLYIADFCVSNEYYDKMAPLFRQKSASVPGQQRQGSAVAASYRRMPCNCLIEGMSSVFLN